MWQVLTVFHEIVLYFQVCFCHESLFWVKKRDLLLLFWYKYLEAHFCLFWFWTSQNRITSHGFMYLENRDFGNKFVWHLDRYLEFFTKKVIWKYPFVKFIWSRITSLLAGTHSGSIWIFQEIGDRKKCGFYKKVPIIQWPFTT